MRARPRPIRRPVRQPTRCPGTFQARSTRRDRRFKVVTSAAATTTSPPWPRSTYPVVGCISVEPQSHMPLCNYGHSGLTSYHSVQVWRGPRDPAHPVVRHRFRPARAWPSGARPSTSRGRGLRLQPADPDRPARGRPSAFPNFGTTPCSTRRRPRPIRPSASRTSPPPPCRWPWWPTAIANGGVIMTPHVMLDIHDSQGNLVTSCTSPSRGCTRHQPADGRRA